MKNALKTAKPVIVLSVICTLICALLIVTYNLTYVDTSGVITDDLMAACKQLDGDASFALVTDRTAAGLDGEEFKDITKIIKNETDGTFLFEIVVDGYSSDGIDAVISLDKNGAVKGISIIALAETPGLGTKINDEAFLSRFTGASGSVEIVKNEPTADNQVQAITGSTLSSRGMAKAVNLALSAYSALNKEVSV